MATMADRPIKWSNNNLPPPFAHLLHVGVLVPELVDPRVQGHGAVPHVARVVDELVLHLHLRVPIFVWGLFVFQEGGGGKKRGWPDPYAFHFIFNTNQSIVYPRPWRLRPYLSQMVTLR